MFVFYIFARWVTISVMLSPPAQFNDRVPGYQVGVVSDFGLCRIMIMGIQKSIAEKYWRIWKDQCFFYTLGAFLNNKWEIH